MIPFATRCISYPFNVRVIVRIELLDQFLCFFLRIRQSTRSFRALRAYSKFSFVIFFYEIGLAVRHRIGAISVKVGHCYYLEMLEDADQELEANDARHR